MLSIGLSDLHRFCDGFELHLYARETQKRDLIKEMSGRKSRGELAGRMVSRNLLISQRIFASQRAVQWFRDLH